MTEKFKKFTLTVISHKNVWTDTEGVKTNGGFGRQIEEISRYFKRTTLVVVYKVLDGPKPGYVIKIPDLEIVPLPYIDGTGFLGKLDFLLKAPCIVYLLWTAYSSADVIHYRIPGYIGVLGLLIHKLRRSKPGFVWFGTDWAERIKESGNTPIRRWMAWLTDGIVNWEVHDLPTFALGKLAEKFAKNNAFLHPTVSTILSVDSFHAEIKTSLASPPRILFVGRFSVEKGLPDLLEALHIADRDGLLLNLTLVGDGPEQENLSKLVQRYNLQDQVHFKGYIPAGELLWECYIQADIFILPSLSEAQGKVLIEAMAAGLPIIATRVGGIPSIIEDGHNGLLVKPHSPQAIADTIQKLVAEPEIRQYIAFQAKKSASKYTIESQTEVLMKQVLQDFQMQGW